MSRNACARRHLVLVAHPGHELRIYGWINQVKPTVCVITDGSGSTGRSRLNETREVLALLGAKAGPLFGGFTDRQLYSCILDGDYGVFEDMRDQLIRFIAAEDFGTVVSDAHAGYNPIHDLCEVLARAAVAAVNRENAGSVTHYTIAEVENQLVSLSDGPANHETAELSEGEFREKLAAIRAYAAKVGAPLEKEAMNTLAHFGESALAHERLLVAAGNDAPERRFDQRCPYYETYGAQQVAAGHYTFVIRFRAHVAPLMERLLAQVSDGSVACGS